jgi:oligoribonuclease
MNIEDQGNLIWIDLEMTGLSPINDRIIEIATLVTDPELNIIAEGPNLAIKQNNEVLEAMDEWNQRHHGATGLIEKVRNSLISESEAETRTIEFLERYSEKKASPMCGNSICQDRRFLANYMPTLEAFFHYRNLDVSSLKELARRWKPDILQGIEKLSRHAALDDVRDSVDELAYYRKTFIDV